MYCMHYHQMDMHLIKLHPMLNPMLSLVAFYQEIYFGIDKVFTRFIFHVQINRKKWFHSIDLVRVMFGQ